MNKMSIIKHLEQCLTQSKHTLGYSYSFVSPTPFSSLSSSFLFAWNMNAVSMASYGTLEERPKGQQDSLVLKALRCSPVSLAYLRPC